MKRLLVLIFIISSLFFSILFQTRSNEDIEGLNIEDIYTQLTDQQLYEFSIFDVGKDSASKFHDELLDYACKQNIIVKTGYNEYLDNGKIIISNYIYDPQNLYFKFIKNHYEYRGNKIDFSHINNQQYISTDLNSSAQGYFILFDSHYLERKKEVYEIKPMKNFVEDYHAVNDNINYYVYIHNEKNIKDIEDLLEKNLASSQYMSFHDATHSHDKNMMNNNYLIFIFFSLSFVIYVIYMFYQKYKEMCIVNLLGYRVLDIFKNYFFKELLISLVALILFLIIYFMIFVSRINDFTISFFIDILSFILIIIALMSTLSMIFVFYIYIKRVHLYKRNNLQNLIYVQLTGKIIYIIVLLMFIIKNIIPNYPYYQIMYTYYQQKDIIDSVYTISNIKDDKRYSQILCENGAIACDFSDILMNQDTEYYIPYIIVNEEYLALYDIELNEHRPTLLVPQKYKQINLNNYDQGLSVKTIYTDETHTFYDPSLVVNSAINDPIILVVNTEYQYLAMDLYLSNNKSIIYYKNLLTSIMDKEDIEIKENSQSIKSIIRESVIPKIWDNSLFLILYIFTYIYLLQFLISIYMKDKEKELSLKIIHGYHYIQLYREIYILDVLTFITPALLTLKFININDILVYLALLLFIDFMFIFYKTKRFQYKIELLKEM